VGRPQAEIEVPESKIRQLAEVGCTDEEIGLIAGIDDATVQRRFASLIKAGRAKMRQSIRHMQIQRAREGSDTMLVWLGKVVLHQKENLDVRIDATDTLAAFVSSIRQAPSGSKQLEE
jgi:N-methylhydantoinase B/oxoprolinase/acetone carboxylase alpha subunit